MKVSILGACSGLGQKNSGLEFAPDIFRKNGFLDLCKNLNLAHFDYGNITPASKNQDALWPFLKELYTRSYEILDEDHLLFQIGGDHSIAIATISATLDRFPDAKIVWIDAHGDMNTPDSSLSGNLHGMPLAALLGLFKNPIVNQKLKKENLTLIGVRDLDEYEKHLIQSEKINVITSEEIENNPEQTLIELKNWLGADSKIHLSFDFDSLDPTIAPATGLRVPGGLSLEFLKNTFKLLKEPHKIISVDFVEFNPNMADNSQEASVSLQSALFVANEILTTRKNCDEK